MSSFGTLPEWSSGPGRESEAPVGRGDWLLRLPPARVEAILDEFDRARSSEGPPTEATHLLIEAAAGAVASEIAAGHSTADALGRVGLRSASPLTDLGGRLVDLAAEVSRNLFPGAAHPPLWRHRLLHHIAYTVLVGGGVNNVPSPDCMAGHLPDDRKATPEELKDAWEACSR